MRCALDIDIPLVYDPGMSPSAVRKKEGVLLKKLRALPPEKVSEVEDFIEFIWCRHQDRELARAVTRLSEGALRKVWDNPDDAAYDRL